MNEIKTMKKNSKKGFTLVELVVVIAILAILAAIAIPVVSSTIASSQRSAALSNAQTLELGLKEAHAQIIAGDTSAGFNDSTTVANVITAKSLQALETSVTIGGNTYLLCWDTTDDKVYYCQQGATAGSIITPAVNLDTNVTPGGTPAPLTISGSTAPAVTTLF